MNHPALPPDHDTGPGTDRDTGRGTDPDTDQEPNWVHGHAHEPNPLPPGADADFLLCGPGGESRLITLSMLYELPQTTVADCYIVSTGHGTSGPFAFRGVRLVDLLAACLPADRVWHQLDVISGDGFGNRVAAHEVAAEGERPFLLATHIDGIALRREAGLVRLIVPTEVNDALRQVKWVARIEVHG